VGAEDDDGELGLFRRLLVFDDSMTPLIIDLCCYCCSFSLFLLQHSRPVGIFSSFPIVADFLVLGDGETLHRAVNKAGTKSVSLEQLCNNTEESCKVYHLRGY